MTKLGYVKDFDDAEKLLLNRIWTNLIPDNQIGKSSD